MAHHSPEIDAEMQKRADEWIEKMKRDMDLGPTEKFPEGKITHADRGEIRIAIGAKDKTVVMHFGVPVEWIGFTPDQARMIGHTIIARAAEIEEQG